MSWQTIAAGETDANSPLNQTLMDKIRMNLDDLNQRAEGGRILLNIGGECNHWDSNVNNWGNFLFEAYAKSVTDDFYPVILRDVLIYIPEGISELNVRPYCRSSYENYNKLTVTVGSSSVDFTNLLTSYSWLAEAPIQSPGAGWQSVSAKATCTGSSATRDIYLAGLIIKAA